MRPKSRKETRRVRKFSTASTKKRVKARQQKGSSVYRMPDDFDFIKITKAGTYRFDILPYIVEIPTEFAAVGELHWERTIQVHYNIGPNQKVRLCPKTVGKRCPICEALDKMRNDPKVSDEDIKPLKAKERQLFYVVDTKNRDKGVQIFESSYYTFGKSIDTRITQAQEDEDNEVDVENFADPENGLTVKAFFEEESIGKQKFMTCSSIDFVPRKSQYEMDTNEELPSLDSLLIVPKYKDLLAEFEGEDEDTDEDDDDTGEEDDDDTGEEDDD
jgi:hypothetical protein